MSSVHCFLMPVVWIQLQKTRCIYCQLFIQSHKTTYFKVISLQPLESEIFSLLAHWDTKVALWADASMTILLCSLFTEQQRLFVLLLVWKRKPSRGSLKIKSVFEPWCSITSGDMFISNIDWVKFHFCFTDFCRALLTETNPRLNLSNKFL